MNVALEINNTYENFELAKDIMYFRVGDRGLVSFHGKNYHIKKRLSSDQMNELISDNFFFKVNTDCYVNLKKIMRIQDGRVYFEVKGTESRYTTITKLRQYRLKEIWQQQQKPREV
ncbi:LytTR family transcriptional regulator DNA-binding domain-containing protein [Paenibacillus aestuarii]|uniref:LytTR family transcriptional regulator DNA-binding domain-containing protein n=1 Tax=Paenibacillus aestuarii TaxID=516965 RepID=A0ABW0K173_9BACL|nr:LytTR family transcriptional regulator DNA-binding domain-containing protein [Paenibacillus aestuarii]